MKRILYIDEPLNPPGGGQISLLTIVRNIDKNRYNFVIFLKDSGSFSRLLEKSNIPFKIVGILSLFSEIKKYNPDIVHINSACTRYSFLAAFYSKLFLKKVIWHNRVLETSRIKEFIIMFFVDNVIAISEAVKNKFLCKKKVLTIYNPIDLSLIKPKDKDIIMKKIGLSNNFRIIGIFSRLEKWKGHALLIKAFSKLEYNNIVLLICGEGSEFNNLKELSHKLNISNRVIFTGFVENVYDYMNICDIIVNPSIEPEPFGRVIIEAMALGKPVIVTDMGGARETIINNYDGILIKPSESDITNAIKSLLTDKVLYEKISKNALEKAKEFDIARYLNKLYTIYDSLSY